MNWRRAAIATACAVPIVALFGYGMTRNPRDIPSPLPGRPAPDFALEVIRAGDGSAGGGVEPGDTLRFADLRGQGVVVNFWASWCLACRDEHTALSQTALAYADSQAQFIGVLYNDRPPAALRWIADMGGQSYPSVLDDRSRMAIGYGLYGVPETFIIDPGGRIAYKHLGPISERVLRTWIDSLLPHAGFTGDVPQPPQR